MIVVEPLSGLCNRMRVINSALSLARRLNRKLVVRWYASDDCNCRFEDLFQECQDIDKVVNCRVGPLLRRYYCHRYRAVLKRLLGQVFIDNREVGRLREEGFDFTALGRHRKLTIASNTRFFMNEQRLEPRADLMAKVDDVTRDFDGVVGVHIRRTDHKKAIDASPTSLFIDVMEEAIREDGGTRFFLATDSPEEEARLKSLFGERIITYPKRSLARSQKAAIQDALVDLYCLSRCRRIVGSSYSSFSRMAGLLAGIQVEALHR